MTSTAASLNERSSREFVSEDDARYAIEFVSRMCRDVGPAGKPASKTPDADSLQPLLQPFERVARVRAVLSRSDFRNWLHLGNDELDGQTPFEVIRKGKIDVVADLVGDMLTGSPS